MRKALPYARLGWVPDSEESHAEFDCWALEQ
jgi:hypothetical protein